MPPQTFTLFRVALLVSATLLFDQAALSAAGADTTAPVVNCSTTTSVIRALDRKFVDVGLTVSASDNEDPAPRVFVQVFSNEDDDETGNRNFSPDARIVPPQVLLRAERSETGQGRVYLIVVTAVDLSGNSAHSVCTVVVPRDQSNASVAQVNQLAAEASAQTSPPVGYSLVGDGPDSSKFLVSITSPADSSSFAWGSSILLSASVNFAATKVEYYDGFTKVGAASTAPFNFALINVGPGQHVLEAIATDSKGGRFSSNPVLFLQRPNVPPVVQLIAPAPNTVVQSGQALELKAEASDSDGAVTKVEFFAGATTIGEKNIPPYTFTWSDPAPETYVLTAVATDTAGARTASGSVTAVVNAPPSISIASPGAQASFQVGEIIPIVVNVADVDGTISKIEFYAGATKIGESTTSPFNISWNETVEGQYSLTVIATDNNGGKTVSSPVITTIAPMPSPTPAPSTTPVPTPAPTPTVTPPPSPTPVPTPPPPLRYVAVDLGNNVLPMRIANNGWILLSRFELSEGGGYGDRYYRWKGGIFERLTNLASAEFATDMNNSGTVVGRSLIRTDPNEVEVGLIWKPDSSVPTRVSAPFAVVSVDPYFPREIKGARFDAINDDGEVFGGIYTGTGYRWVYGLYDIVNAYRWPADWLVNGGEPEALRTGTATVMGTWDGGNPPPIRLEGAIDSVWSAKGHESYTGLTMVPDDDPFWPTQKGMVNGNTVSFFPLDVNKHGLVIGQDWYSANGFVLDPDGTRHVLDGATYPIAINDFVRPGVDAEGNPADIPAPQIVGYRLKSPDVEPPAIWEYFAPKGEYVPHYLEDLVVKSGVWDFNLRQFWRPQAMNDRGAIVSVVVQYDAQWNYQWTHGVLLLPVEFTITRPNAPDSELAQNPNIRTVPTNKVPRDEIINVRIKILALSGQDLTINLNVSPDDMRTQALGSRDVVQMYDFGEVQDDGSVKADTTQITLNASDGGEKTIKAVFAKEGTLNIRIESLDGKIKADSQPITVDKQMRKYAKLGASTYDFNQYDKAFQDAYEYWRGVYAHGIDDVERLKAIGMTESELGRNPTAPVNRPEDIMTIGNPGDHVLDILHALPGHVESEVDIQHNSVRVLNYPDAAAGPAAKAILYGTCWLYHKAQTIVNNPNPPPDLVPGLWRSWDDATTRYNGGGVPNYLERVNRAFKEGRHPTDNISIWPLKTDRNARQ